MYSLKCDLYGQLTVSPRQLQSSLYLSSLYLWCSYLLSLIFSLSSTIRVHNWFISERKKIHMEKAMLIKIYMYHMSDSIICKHNVYGISISDCVYSHFWHEVHTESNIYVQSLYATHMSIPSLLSFNRVENCKKHHFQAFQPLSNYIIIIPNDQKPCKVWFCTSRKENS